MTQVQANIHASDASPSGIPSDPFEGTQYRALARLAAGGMGEVFLVEQTKLGKQFAAKVLHASLASDLRLLERMRIEAESLGSLQHANIVAAFDFQRTRDRRPFVIMEYLKGRTLDMELEIRGALSVEESLVFASQLLSALAAAHELGIVHRDIKPSNLFLCEAPSGPRQLKVLDFGVARVLPDASANAPDPTAIPTATGVLVGTPRYLSPEGAVGKRVDTRADLYAAALMLYIMLAGRGPFDEMLRDTAMLAAHAYMEPPRPSEFGTGKIPAALEALVIKGLSKEPEARYQTAVEFKRLVDDALAMLRCPPKLRETGLVAGALEPPRAAPPQRRSEPAPTTLPLPTTEPLRTTLPLPISELPRATTPVLAPANNLRVTVLGSIVLFVLVGVVTALVLLSKGHTP